MLAIVKSKLAKSLLNVRNFVELLLIDTWQMQLWTNIFQLGLDKFPANIYLFKVNNTNTKKKWNIFKVNNENTKATSLTFFLIRNRILAKM